MFKVDAETNVITMTRGDYGLFSVEILKAKENPTDPDEFYELEEGDVVYFTVKKNTKSDTPLIQKTGLLIEILHDDTKDLNYGTYVYDVQLTHANGEPDTFITYTDFVIEQEVTW